MLAEKLRQQRERQAKEPAAKPTPAVPTPAPGARPAVPLQPDPKMTGLPLGVETLREVLARPARQLTQLQVLYEHYLPVQGGGAPVVFVNTLACNLADSRFYWKRFDFSDTTHNALKGVNVRTWDGMQACYWERQVKPEEELHWELGEEPADPGVVTRTAQPVLTPLQPFQSILHGGQVIGRPLDLADARQTLTACTEPTLGGQVLLLEAKTWTLAVHLPSGWMLSRRCEIPEGSETWELRDFALVGEAASLPFPTRIHRTLRLPGQKTAAEESYRIFTASMRVNEEVEIPTLTLPPLVREQKAP